MEVIHDVHRQVDQDSGGFNLSLENGLQGGFNLFRKAPAELIAVSLFGVLGFFNPLT